MRVDPEFVPEIVDNPYARWCENCGTRFSTTEAHIYCADCSSDGFTAEFRRGSVSASEMTDVKDILRATE